MKVARRHPDGSCPIAPAAQGGAWLRRRIRCNAWLRRRFAVDLRSLAAFRIAAGTILVVDALLRVRDFPLMFTTDGIFPLAPLRQTWGADPAVWSLAFLVDHAWCGGLVLAAQGLAGLCLACGWRTRAATIVAWAAQLSVMRRTLPATNAGDAWLGTLLFWSMFLPLGAVWSADAARRGAAGRAGSRTFSSASIALVLQVLVVYLAAGLAKLNDTWLTGEAIGRALSIHDHGTSFGTWMAGAGWLLRPLTWGVLGIELLLPALYLLFPRPRLRVAVACCFILFHLAIQATMSVGLFAAIGITAWLALLPGAVWQTPAAADADPDPGRLPPLASAACGLLLGCASIGFLHNVTPWQSRPLPAVVGVPLALCGLVQEWGMFGVVSPTEQWIQAPALLGDGRRVDLLRNGAPVGADRPGGGFGSLPHHRWHKLAWLLPRPRFRLLAPHVAAALARDWNARHGADSRVESLEIRFVVEGIAAHAGQRHEQLLATWPDRGTEGRGNLDRFLDDAGSGPAAAR